MHEHYYVFTTIVLQNKYYLNNNESLAVEVEQPLIILKVYTSLRADSRRVAPWANRRSKQLLSAVLICKHIDVFTIL